MTMVTMNAQTLTERQKGLAACPVFHVNSR